MGACEVVMEIVPAFFSFSGRIRRRYFLPGAILALSLYGMVFALRAFMTSSRAILGSNILGTATVQLSYLLMCLSRVVSGVSFFSFHVRRLHDMNRSGWWAGLICLWEVWLFFFFPESWSFSTPEYLSLILLPIVIFVLIPPTTGKNRYGEDPREVLSAR
jgi:uncharacterized membrane protein YhaH (DUF805 family)